VKMAHFIGVDLGGTKIAAVAYDAESQQVIHRHTVATDGRQGAEGVIQQMIALVRLTAHSAGWPPESVSGVGVGVPAVIDYDTGHTLILPNIPGNWNNQPVTAPMQSSLSCPVFLVNDARAFTLAEATIGAGRGYSIVAGITLGTGIGGGIAIDGKLLLGLNGAAGEFGHICIDLNGLPDGSGTPGGMEGYGSGPAIAAAATKAVMQGINTCIGSLVNYDLNAITPAVVAKAADEGDEIAQQILTRAGHAIGAGIANVLTILNPHVLVIGGGVAALGSRILDPMREGLILYNNTHAVEKLAIVPAEVLDAGAVGAALWARQRVNEIRTAD
jgi:glucokinase